MADPNKFTEAIEAVSRSSGVHDAETGAIERQSPNKEKFEALLNEETVIVRPKDEGVKPSIFDEVRQLSQQATDVYKASPKDITNRADHLIAEIESLKQRLSEPHTEIRSSMQSLLENRLTHIGENIRIALSKVGVDYEPSKKVAAASENPVERFLGLLTDGQGRLEKLTNDIDALSKGGQHLDPASMLMIQVKVSYVQQELEFFTSLLNKSLESTKTIMNVQV